ncbi:DciA family protein [Shimia sp. SDUM112013]|uniref:DUF721 domain-containing protein n=1 Tax=Shimia sp. SDUM112013 TaxID=3136160 RepID=UPI0032ED71A8
MRRSTTKGFARTSSLLREQIRETGETRGFAATRVLTHWAEIVGEDMAAVCKPVEVKYGRQGLGATLTVLTTGAQAPMLEMQKDQLRARVNQVYGYNAIERLRITQTAATGFAEGQAVFAHKSKPAPKTETPELRAEAAKLAEQAQDSELRAALERLSRNFLKKTKL